MLVAFASLTIVYRLWVFVVLDDEFSSCVEIEPYFRIHSYLNTTILPLLQGTCLALVYMQFWGACVGDDVLLLSSFFFEAPLLTLESKCVIDAGAQTIAHVFRHGQLEFGSMTIDRGATLHPFSLAWTNDKVRPGVSLAPRSQLALTMPTRT